MWRGERMYFSTSTRGSPKALCGLALGALQGGVEIGRLLDPPHALAAAARDRLDENRIADLVGLLAQEIRLLPGAVIARHDRHAGLLHQGLGGILQAHGPDGGGGRADEDDAVLRAGLGEFGPLGQEAVAGMDAGGARALLATSMIRSICR